MATFTTQNDCTTTKRSNLQVLGQSIVRGGPVGCPVAMENAMHGLSRKLGQSCAIGRVFSPLASAEGHLRSSDHHATAAVFQQGKHLFHQQQVTQIVHLECSFKTVRRVRWEKVWVVFDASIALEGIDPRELVDQLGCKIADRRKAREIQDEHRHLRISSGLRYGLHGFRIFASGTPATKNDRGILGRQRLRRCETDTAVTTSDHVDLIGEITIQQHVLCSGRVRTCSLSNGEETPEHLKGSHRDNNFGREGKPTNLTWEMSDAPRSLTSASVNDARGHAPVSVSL